MKYARFVSPSRLNGLPSNGLLAFSSRSPAAGRALNRIEAFQHLPSLLTSKAKNGTLKRLTLYSRPAVTRQDGATGRRARSGQWVRLFIADPDTYLARARLDCKSYFHRCPHRDSLHDLNLGAGDMPYTPFHTFNYP